MWTDSISRRHLESLRPSPTELLDLLRSRVDDSMLREIAHADYGDDADQHLDELRRMHATSGFVPMDFVPDKKGDVLFNIFGGSTILAWRLSLPLFSLV